MAVTSSETISPPTSIGRRAWQRLQTPIVVAVVGIASAWLLQAIAHQWEDHKKAQELKATLVTDMASATSRMLVRAEAVHPLGDSVDRARPARSSDWTQKSLEIEARLRAYFPYDIVETWQLYSYFASYYDPSARSDARTGQFLNAALDVRKLPSRPAIGFLTIGAPLLDKARTESEIGFQVFDELRRQLGAEAARQNPGLPDAARRAPDAGYVFFQTNLIALEQQIADSVLAADPKGYSTTRRDFFRDLIP